MSNPEQLIIKNSFEVLDRSEEDESIINLNDFPPLVQKSFNPTNYVNNQKVMRADQVKQKSRIMILSDSRRRCLYGLHEEIWPNRHTSITSIFKINGNLSGVVHDIMA